MKKEKIYYLKDSHLAKVMTDKEVGSEAVILMVDGDLIRGTWIDEPLRVWACCDYEFRKIFQSKLPPALQVKKMMKREKTF